MSYLTDYVGQIIQVICPVAFDSTCAVVASDDATGVSIEGMDKVVFLIGIGSLQGGTMTYQVQYSSTGSASDAVTSNAGMTCTDAAQAVTSDGASEVYVIEFDISAKGMSDAVGKLFVTATAASNAVGVHEVVAIPIPSTAQIPITQQNTVVKAAA